MENLMRKFEVLITLVETNDDAFESANSIETWLCEAVNRWDSRAASIIDVKASFVSVESGELQEVWVPANE
jgi:hypothetical protein